MKTIPYQQWERRPVYEFFSGMSNPFFSVSFRQDVTGLYRYVKAHDLSFYKGMIWACTEAVNGIAAFRTAMHEGVPVLLDRRDPSFTDMRRGREQFYIVTMDHLPEIDAFCREASRISVQQNVFIDLSRETDALIYYSCLPWIDLTGLTNERDLSAPGALDDSIPRIAWGRYTEQDGRIMLGMSVEVNHRFIDGVQIGQFAQALSGLIGDLESTLQDNEK